MTEVTRYILESQGPYIGRTNQRLVSSGPRGRLEWVSAGGGGDFFDPSPNDMELLEKHGSPLVVYSNGQVEKFEG